MTNITFRACTPEDIEQAVPLIYDAGPDAYDYAFSDSSPKQSIDFLLSAFKTKGSEFSYDQHTVMLRDNVIVGIGGIKTAKQNLKFTLAATKLIFRFYSLFGAFRTIVRGLKTESVIHPPKANLGMIHNLAISPDYRGEGLGQQLINYLEQQMRTQGFSTAALDVAETNPRAKALYQRLGYEEVTFHLSNVIGKYSMVPAHYYMEKSL